MVDGVGVHHEEEEEEHGDRAPEEKVVEGCPVVGVEG